MARPSTPPPVIELDRVTFRYPQAETPILTEISLRVEHLRDRITYDLSGGEKQRVALAAVHALAPQVFLFDNPTSQLDPLGAADVLESIRQVADTHGFSIVLVEDKVDELVRVADRMVLLDRGRITLDAAPRDFCLSSGPLASAGVRSTQIAELSAELLGAGVPFADPG